MQDIIKAMSRHDGSHAFIPLHGLFPSSVQDNFTPPVPISKMSIEELMQVLPALDAAIIAHDWLPCMQARHSELKTSLQEKAEEALDANLRIQQFTDKLQDIINSSGIAAATWMDMVDIAEEHQTAQLAVADLEVELARTKAQKEEVVSVLARHISRHIQMCEDHKREKADLTARCEEILKETCELVLDDMTEIVGKELLARLRQLREALDQTYNNEQSTGTDTVRVDLTRPTAHEEEIRRLLYAQQETLAQQSSDLDRFVDLLSKATRSVKDKNREIEKLRAANAELQHRSGQQSDRSSPMVQEHGSACDSSWQVVESPETEVSSLRRKLEKAYHREQQLQIQLLQLMQAAQSQQEILPSQPDKQGNPSRFRRFLTRNFRDQNSTSVPRSSSMQNLGLFANASPTEKNVSLERRASSNSARTIRPSPPSTSSSTSHATDSQTPSVGSICDPTSGEIEWSSQPPRVREAVLEQQNAATTLTGAVGARSQHMPRHVKVGRAGVERRPSSSAVSKNNSIALDTAAAAARLPDRRDVSPVEPPISTVISNNLNHSIIRTLPTPPHQSRNKNETKSPRPNNSSSLPILSADLLSYHRQQYHSAHYTYPYTFNPQFEHSCPSPLQSSPILSPTQNQNTSQNQTRPSTRVLSGITEVSEDLTRGGSSSRSTSASTSRRNSRIGHTSWEPSRL